MLMGEAGLMTRNTIRRMASVAVIAIVVTLVFSLLGWAMMPQWHTQPYADHIAVQAADPAIMPSHADIAHEGRYRTRATKLTVKTDDGAALPAVLREPIGAPGPRPACLFIHGSGTSGAEDFGDIANAMSSAGIVTLVPAKRNDNYTVLHRDYPRFAREYGRSLEVLRGTANVDPAKTGVYAESEGTWIATILASEHRDDIAFAILTSAPVFKGREQMAMAVSAYVQEAGAPEPVVKDMAKLMSLDYAPFDLAYADFDADHYLRFLSMPLLVNYGTYDTAMPIEQGAQRIIDAAHSVGNDNVTVRYFAGNHQMRAGKGLFTPNLPLAEGYTQALENWVNGVAVGTGADGWATPQIAGAKPYQRFAAPQRTNSGIIGSLGVLVGVMAAGPILMIIAALLGIGADLSERVRSRFSARRISGRTMPAGWDKPYVHDGQVHGIAEHRETRGGRPGERPGSRSAALFADGGRIYTLRNPMALHARRVTAQQHMPRGLARLSVGIGIAIVTVTALLYGYMSAVGVSAVFVAPHSRLFAAGWVALRLLTAMLVVLFAWELERIWRYRGGILGVRRVICTMVILAALATLTTLAFWGLFSF